MVTSPSSRLWLQRNKNNFYTNLAQQQNLPSRSYFKLEEIQNKYHFLRKDCLVLDLGCSPGGWSLFTKKYTTHIHGCDLLNNMTIPIEKFILGDFLQGNIQGEFSMYNNIYSDMAINASGNKWLDQYKNFELAEHTWSFVKLHLLPHGNFIIKLFESDYTIKYVKEIKKYFYQVHKFKPKASYKNSSEIYLVALKFK
jgi:23S rRNA (uridine2552-2'-O)-methyltransferase